MAAPDQAASHDWVMPLDQLNKQLPAWIRFTGRFRTRWEMAAGIGFGVFNDGYLLTQLRVGLILQPVKWLSFVGETQDSRVFFNQRTGNVPPYQNTWDVRQAYGELGSSKEGWADLMVGRQVLSFGDERLIGPSDWLNQGRTFDTVRFDVHQPGFNVALFASSVVVARDGVVDHHYEGNDTYGVYSSFTRLIPQSTVEPYVIWRVAPGNLRLNENQGRGALNEFTGGVRWVGKLPARFGYNVEMDKQGGSLGPDTIASWAGHWRVDRGFETRFGQLTPFIESNYASGTRNYSSTNWNTFDQIYPSSHDKLGFADLVGWRNIRQVRGGLEENISKNWKTKQTFEDFWLANTHDALYGTSGALVVRSTNPNVSSHVGEELDLVFERDFNRAMILGFGWAHFFTGPFLNATARTKDYNYPYLYFTYRL